MVDFLVFLPQGALDIVYISQNPFAFKITFPQAILRKYSIK